MVISSSSPAIADVNAKVSVPGMQASRVISVDLLRGLVMVIMALDHTRDFFTNLHFAPEDLAHTYGALFFTRVITHYCAPVFFLLAGTGAFLATSRGKSVQQISWFFFTRGLWLVFLELTVIGFAWSFMLSYGLAGVIWALGWSMVAMALIVRLPVRWIAILGVTMVAVHNLLDRIGPASFGKLSWLWMLLHSPGIIWIKPPTAWFFVGYPLIPWIGVMAAGYALGALLLAPDRRKRVLTLGIGLTALFFVLRGFNLYGNGIADLPFGFPRAAGPWSLQPSLTLTVISFFNTLKYPPSLDYLLMTLGPALILLAWFDGVKAERGVARILLVYGRVPLFYYVLHLYLIHVIAVVTAWIFHQPAAQLWHGVVFLFPVPDGYGHSLPFIYSMWVAVVALLYLPCRWFMEFKRRHKDWAWLSYL